MTAVTEHEVSLVPATDHSPAIRSLSVSDFPTLVGREEEWRFTPLARLRGLHTGELGALSPVAIDAVVSGGATFDAHSAKSADRGGFTDRVAAYAWEQISDVATLTIPANTVVDETITVSIAGTGGVAFNQLDINVGQFGKATVVVTHSGSATFAGNIDINVADGGQITVVSIQDWDRDAVHAGHHRIRLGRDATAKHVAVTLGGDLVRLLPNVDYDAPGGSAEFFGLYFASAGQHAEHRLFVDHSVPNCRSNVVYKGALNGDDAHTVWIGDVLIRAAALGTETYEINRNLVLSGGGRADSVPNLEIETGEIVGAGHASTTGRFDDEQLFYLQSRGISENEARRLVLRGFFEDLLNQIDVPEINDTVRERLQERLEGAQ